jgi:hypothetical protein
MNLGNEAVEDGRTGLKEELWNKRGRGERGEKNTCDNWFRSNYPVAWGTRRTGLIEREHKWERADIIKDRCRERVLRSLMTLDTQKAASGGDALSNGLGLL